MCALAEIVSPLMGEVEAFGADYTFGAAIVAVKQKLPPPTIAKLVAREDIDSRGNSTVEVDDYVPQPGDLCRALVGSIGRCDRIE
jgi:hypothetical protein